MMIVQDAAAARSILDDVRRDIAGALVPYGGVNLSCTMSIGAAIGQPNTLEELVSEADTLLYKAKETGRDRVVAEPCRV